VALILLSGCTADGPAPPPLPATSTTPTAPPTLPEGLVGGPATGGIGITALLPTTGPTLFDADRGSVATPPGYPGGDVGMSVLRVGKSAVLIAYPAGTTDPLEAFVYTGPASPPRSLGHAWSVAPAVDGESVWVIRPDAPDACRLQRVSLSGGELGPGQPASCRTEVRAGTPHGLLITIDSGNTSSTDALIDPDTGRTVQQAPRILGVAGDWMLLDGLTELTLVDLRNNRHQQLSRPVIARTPTVVPSRDGGVWAVDFADPAYRSTSTQTRDLWLLHPDTPNWEHVAAMPFITEHLKRGGGFGWSDAGDLVLADGVLAAWHPGEPRWRLGKAALPTSTWSGFAVLP
jgi:hypothetical protein